MQATTFQAVEATLDRYYEVAQSGLMASAVLATFQLVAQLRRTTAERWSELVKSVCRPHPLFGLYQECPMTRRCVEKPRGYAGDAVMLDFIYDRNGPLPAAPMSPLGAEVFRTMVNTPTCGSVDFRRQLIAKRIDVLSTQRRQAGLSPLRVLSLACGHARELELSKAVRDGALGPVMMLDQDALSLDRIRARFPDSGLIAEKVSVRDVLANRISGQYDFVYTAGLYDYLDQRIATRLTTRLFDLVAPGGELLLANFHPDNHGTGFMEAFMDWWLIYRTDEEMRVLCNEVDSTLVAAIDPFGDPFGNVTYLRVRRRH